MTHLVEAGLRTITYNRRGHRRSTDPGHADLATLARDLAAVIDGLDLHGVTLVAQSGGAGEAIRYASRFGCGCLRRLVLVGGTGRL